MGQNRGVSTPANRSGCTPGVVGAEARYPTQTPVAVSLTVAGCRLLPVGPLRVYTCGITPYDVTHVGHAATFVWADVICNLARTTGAEVLLCRNVTDVDDVLTAAARDRSRHYDEFALTQEFLFDRDMRALGVADPPLKPHARSHIDAVQRLAAALLDAGAAYEHDGYVYFRGQDLPDRAGLTEEAALAASRDNGDQVEVPGRASPFDVPVWRPSAPDHPAWPSPWGWGRPGWHAECAAMAMTSLGTSIDVLAGGSDLAFPHHTYQQAMVEAASGCTPFARAVVHIGEVRRNGVKMAKSAQNLVLVSDLLHRYTGAQVRLGLLNRDWSAPWDCTDDEFDAAGGLLEQLHSAAGKPAAGTAARNQVRRTLSNELDVPNAVRTAVEEGGEAARWLVAALRLRAAGAL